MNSYNNIYKHNNYALFLKTIIVEIQVQSRFTTENS